MTAEIIPFKPPASAAGDGVTLIDLWMLVFAARELARIQPCRAEQPNAIARRMGGYILDVAEFLPIGLERP